MGFSSLDTNNIGLAAGCKWKRKKQKYCDTVTVLLRLQMEVYLNFWNLKKHSAHVTTRGKEKPPKAADGCINKCV